MQFIRCRSRVVVVARRAAVPLGMLGLLAAVPAAAAPGQGTGGRPAQARATAVVTTHVRNARAAGNKVIQTEMIFSAAVPPVWVWNYRSDWRLTQSGYIPPSAALAGGHGDGSTGAPATRRSTAGGGGFRSTTAITGGPPG